MSDNADPQSKGLRMKDVADEYGLTERHVRDLVARRKIPYYKVGRVVLIDRAAFEAWLAEQRVEAL